MIEQDTIKEIDNELFENLDNQKPDLAFLKEVGFEEKFIEDFKEDIPKNSLSALNDNSHIVLANIKYLKDLGISNYKDAFQRFYSMFLIEPTAFDDIFSKYDKDDLVAKMEKNIAIMEHL